MNIEVSLVSFIFLLIFMKLYTEKYSKKTTNFGNLIEIHKSGVFKDLELDITSKTKLYTPIFSKYPSFMKKVKITHKVKNRQGILFEINSSDIKSEWLVYLYDKDLNLIKSFYNPSELLFSNVDDRENIQHLESEKEYIFIIKYNSSEDTPFDYSIVKYQDIGIMQPTPYVHPSMKYFDESDIIEKLNEVKMQVIEEMKEKGYAYGGIKKSKERVLFPSNEVTYYSEIKMFKGDVIVILSVNRGDLTGHKIEINSDFKDTNWYPSNNGSDIIPLYVIDNQEEEETFKIYERMNNIGHNSTLIPFEILKFKL